MIQLTIDLNDKHCLNDYATFHFGMSINDDVSIKVTFHNDENDTILISREDFGQLMALYKVWQEFQVGGDEG